jgi:hypothetical protein
VKRWALVVLLIAQAVAAGPKKPAVPKPAPAKTAYVSLATVVDRSKTAGVVDAGARALETSLSAWRLTRAPAGESDADARAALKRLRLKGLELALSVASGSAGAVEASLLVASYPERALTSEYRAQGSGGSVLELVPPLVEQLVSDLAKAEGWARVAP